MGVIWNNKIQIWMYTVWLRVVTQLRILVNLHLSHGNKCKHKLVGNRSVFICCKFFYVFIGIIVPIYILVKYVNGLCYKKPQLSWRASFVGRQVVKRRNRGEVPGPVRAGPVKGLCVTCQGGPVQKATTRSPWGRRRDLVSVKVKEIPKRGLWAG